MPWTTPETFTSGQTLTAASMNVISGNARMGRAVFTNEAARDAAITAPEEGMIAYLTTPTVDILSATGATTAVPTGITTIYNGSVWVCVTEVAASSSTQGTTTHGSTDSYVTTLTGDGTAISVTLVTGTTVLLSYGWRGNVAGNGQAIVTYSVSGATTVAAADSRAMFMGFGGTNMTVQHHGVITGLTAGTNTFTFNYRSTNSQTLTMALRWLVAKGIA